MSHLVLKEPTPLTNLLLRAHMMINTVAFSSQQRAIPLYNHCTLDDISYTNAPMVFSKLLLRLKRSTSLHFCFHHPIYCHPCTVQTTLHPCHYTPQNRGRPAERKPVLAIRSGDQCPTTHLVLVKEEASSLSRRVYDKREPVAEPLQHDSVLQAQIVGRQPHDLSDWYHRSTPLFEKTHPTNTDRAVSPYTKASSGHQNWNCAHAQSVLDHRILSSAGQRPFVLAPPEATVSWRLT